MVSKRPMNVDLLDLFKLDFPPMAIASIMHRITGVILFLLFPGALYLFGVSLQSLSAYEYVHVLLSTHIGWKLFVWIFGSCLMYHIFAGIRHLAMDIGWGEDLETGRRTAMVVLVLGVILTIIIGIWVWL